MRPARPDVLSVIVGSSGYDDLVDRTEYLDRIHGMDEAVVGRVRDLRDQVKRDRSPGCAAPRTGSKPPATRSPPKSRRWRAPAPPCRAASRPWSRPAASASRRWRKISEHEEELDGSVAAIQGKIAAQLAGTGSVPLPAGPIQGGSGSGLIWPVDGPVVSGFGSRTINGSYEYHPGIDIAVPEAARRSAPPRPAP